MNGYIAIHKGRKIEVHAETSYEAQCEAAKLLGVKDSKRHEITVVLCEKQGQQVTHSTSSI